MSSETKGILTILGAIIVLWLLYSWHSKMEWQAARESVIKAHQGERITPEALKEIDEETSEII